MRYLIMNGDATAPDYDEVMLYLIMINDGVNDDEGESCSKKAFSKI